MAQGKIFPRVFDPKSVKEFSAACYQALYENNDEAKRYVKLVEVNYCSLISTLGDSEKTYMQIYISTGFHLAKKLKDVELRKMNREESLKKIKTSDLKKAEEIRDSDLEKNKEVRDQELGKIKSERKVWRKVIEVAPVSIGSLLIGLNYLSPMTASGVAGVTTIVTYTVSELRHSKRTNKREEILNDYYDENNVVLYNYREQQQIIENDFSIKREQIEDDVDKQKRKHFTIEEEKLAKLYIKFIGRDEDESQVPEIIVRG